MSKNILDPVIRRSAASIMGENAEIRHQQSLLKTGALQDAIFNSANFSSIATDAKGVIQIFNVGAERMLGYTAAEVVNKITPADISDPQELITRAEALSAEFGTTISPGFERLVFKAARGIEDIYELTYIRKDGSRFPAVVSVTALRDAQDTIIGYLLIGTDNTARKQAMDLEQRYRRLFQSAKDGILILDAETGMVVDANPFITELLGYSLDDVREKYIWDLGFFKNIAANKEKFLELQQQEYVRYDDLPLETVQGKKIHVEFVSNVYLVGNSKVIQCNIRDITRRKQAEDSNLRLNQMYRTISRCNESLVRASDEFGLAKEMCRILTEVGGFRLAWVGYAESGADKHILPIAGTGADDGYLESLSLTWADEARGRRPAGVAIRSGNLAQCQDILNDPSFAPWREDALQRGYQSLIALPLKENERVFGVLSIYAGEPFFFKDDMLELMAELAGDLSFGIANLRAKAERTGMLGKLEHSLDNAVAAIAATTEMRDPYTAGHQRRVAKLATAIAVEMGLTEAQVQGVHMAAVVHDIGKIHVPAEILSSPAKLSDPEFAILKGHPKAGWEILNGIEFPWPVAEIVYQHHERQDGSGYPRGLKGDEILLEARILTVADVVEAMSSHRPYRPGFGVFAAALQEISRQKGKFYDEKVVEACLRIFMEKDYVL